MNSLFVLPALFERGFAGGCAEGRRPSNMHIPLMVEAVLVILFSLVARGRPQLVSASRRPELRSGVRLLARLGPPRECGCRFYIRFAQILDDM